MMRLKNLLLTHLLNNYRNSSAPPMYTSKFSEAIYNFASSATSKNFFWLGILKKKIIIGKTQASVVEESKLFGKKIVNKFVI